MARRALLLRYFLLDTPLLVVTVSYIAIVSLFNLVIPLLMKILVDYLLVEKVFTLLNVFFAAIFLILIFRFLAVIVQDLMFLSYRQRIEKKLLRRYVDRLLHFELADMQAMNLGDLINRATSIINSFQSSISHIVYYCFYAVIISVSCLCVLYWINQKIFEVAALSIALHAINFFICRFFLSSASAAYFSDKKALSGELNNIFSGFVQVKMFGLSKAINHLLAERIGRFCGQFFRVEFIKRAQELVQNALVGLSFLAILYVGSQEIQLEHLSLGNLMLSILLLSFLYEPVYQLSIVNRAFQDTRNQLRNLDEIMAIAKQPSQKIQQNTANTTDQNSLAQLLLADISIGYRQDNPILQHINLHLEAGKIYLLSAPSGSGKTTLLYALSGWLPILSGKFCWNNVQVQPADDPQWRERSLFVTRDDALFTGTVLENITCFDPQPNGHAVEHATTLAVADQFIRTLPKGLQTHLKDGGRSLSGGQRRRLHLARCFYRAENKKLWLLDEPTANIDEMNELHFFEQLQSLRAGRVIILVSHSPQAERFCDVILRLRNGTFLMEEKH